MILCYYSKNLIFMVIQSTNSTILPKTALDFGKQSLDLIGT